MRLSVRTHGPLDAQAMVLLHGLTSDGSSFDGVVETLAQNWRVYVPDQRGHGTTGPAEAYAFELLAADLDEFLEERGLTAPVVVGHSMGAVAAYLHAARRPDRTGPLVLVEPPPPFPQRRPVPERPDEPLGYDWDARVALVGQVNSPDPGWFDELAEIRVPTLVLGGGPTSPFPQDQLRTMADRMPRGSFQEIPVGHSVHREAPTAFLAAVTTFLDTAI
ncbi:alpha/beta fold hydrolase [Kribbella sp. NBC_00359]|uniref:alpha/beta fold hydrolase n=1 Tax=Kribbella sp. NBC_00359 TaxID=2975966 RepID=UPI002E24A3B2